MTSLVFLRRPSLMRLCLFFYQKKVEWRPFYYSRSPSQFRSYLNLARVSVKFLKSRVHIQGLRTRVHAAEKWGKNCDGEEPKENFTFSIRLRGKLMHNFDGWDWKREKNIIKEANRQSFALPPVKSAPPPIINQRRTFNSPPPPLPKDVGGDLGKFISNFHAGNCICINLEIKCEQITLEWH